MQYCIYLVHITYMLQLVKSWIYQNNTANDNDKNTTKLETFRRRKKTKQMTLPFVLLFLRMVLCKDFSVYLITWNFRHTLKKWREQWVSRT